MLRLYRQSPDKRAAPQSIRYLAAVLAALWCLSGYAQTTDSSSVKKLFEQERWPELAQLLEHTSRDSADLNYYYGLALAHLERWNEARKALLAGEQLAPRDKRFPIALAAIAFKQQKSGEAKHHL